MSILQTSTLWRARTLTFAAVAGLIFASPAGAAPLSDEAAREALAALGGESRSAAESTIDQIVTAKDTRFVAVFIELLRAAGIGVATVGVGVRSADALGSLTGETFDDDWSAWVRWYRGTELEPPPGFLGFKGRLLGRVDDRFETLLRDGQPVRIRPEEIVWGGVAYEGIPALDQPRHRPAADATDMEPGEPVFGVMLGGAARAYPLRILDWHEMSNDILGGVPFSLAYCTLCGSGIAYETRVDGRTFDFGSSGLLMRSNKLMIDRQTRTLWNQLTGRPVLGPLANAALKLRVAPSVLTSWADWKRRHPDTTVLSFETGHRRPYRPGAAYAGYFASPGTMFPVQRTRTALPDKARVFGLERDGAARAWPLDVILREKILNDQFVGESIVLVGEGERIWVDGYSVRSGPARYEAGAAVRAYRRGSQRFEAGPEPGLLRGEDGGHWRVEEEALVGPGDERLKRVAGTLAYWFGWAGFHANTELYSAPE